MLGKKCWYLKKILGNFVIKFKKPCKTFGKIFWKLKNLISFVGKNRKFRRTMFSTFRKTKKGRVTLEKVGYRLLDFRELL